MLTADLVRAYRRGSQLKLRKLAGADRARARALAAQYVAMARAHVGKTRAELDEALAAVPVHARDRKLAAGLRKLVMDRCEFEVERGRDPAALRRQVFARACARRKELQAGERFDRDQVLAEVAAEHDLPAEEIDRLLYIDLRSAHRLLSFAALDADALVDVYVDSQAQAVLLRAVHVVARVRCSSPGVYRALFRKLKFLRLLYVIEPLDETDGGQAGGYQITIDGPYSLFRSVTKYGLQLALLLPALRACDRWSITAQVQWGKRRQPLELHIDSSAHPSTSEPEPPHLPDEVAALLERCEQRFAAGQSPWRAQPCSEILHLPGVGLCVPDLMFVHRETGECVYLEVLGFWSRQAVWKRVELVEGGLPHRIVFAVSSRLRVSEAALDADLPGALYVYKGVMSARAIEERLDRLTGS